MTIDERITESKKSIKVPPFDFDKAFERIKKQKEKKIHLFKKKLFLIFSSCMAITAVLLAILIPINLLDSRPRTIEIGFNQNSDNGFARPYETQFETMIRTDTKAEKLKKLEVFYGNYHTTDWDSFTFSKKQTLILSLKRAIISNSSGKTISEKEISSQKQDISYFFSRQFYSKENSIIDVVTYDDLSSYESTGILLYTFTIEPLDGDTFASVFVGGHETAYGKENNKVECYEKRSIRYVLKDGLIELLEPEKKENINE